MRKKIGALVLLSLVLFPVVIMAQYGPPSGSPGIVPQNLDVMTVLERIVDWTFSILLIFAAIMIVVAAFYFVTAAGNTEQVAKARNFVLWALVGVLVAYMARGLVWFIGRIVGIH